MPVTRCAVCKIPALASTQVGIKQRNWLCPACRDKFNNGLLAESSPVGEPCRKCKKINNGKCRFTAVQRQRITACSDWEGKNTRHNQKRWAKFE